MKFGVLFLISILSVSAVAQPRKISGFVLDAATQKPMKNVNIVLKGTTHGTVSNYLGAFELTIEDPVVHNTLVASHIGFKIITFIIPKQDRFRFTMEKEYVQLDDIQLGSLPVDELPVDPPDPTPAPKGFTVVESGAQYPDGVNHFLVHAGNVLKRDLGRIKNNFVISFTIDTTGRAIDIQVSDSTKAVTESVGHVFRETRNWTPATQRGKKVSQHFQAFVSNGVDQEVIKKFFVYLSDNVEYPALARRMGIVGAVDIEFSVDTNGKATDIHFIRDIGADTDKEMKQVLESMPPALAMELVEATASTRFALPLSFGLDEPFKRGPALTSSGAVYPIPPFSITGNGLGRPTQPADLSRVNLEEAMRYPTRAKRLSLRRQLLAEIPPDVFQLKKLEFLDLENNKIAKVDDRIGTLKGLRELYLPANLISELPDAISNLNELTVLGLAKNQFTDFPAPILKLEKLIALDLGGNALTSIPDEIKNMKKLKILVISDNFLDRVPPVLFEMNSLKSLVLKGNPISISEIEKLKAALKRVEIVF